MLRSFCRLALDGLKLAAFRTDPRPLPRLLIVRQEILRREFAVRPVVLLSRKICGSLSQGLQLPSISSNHQRFLRMPKRALPAEVQKKMLRSAMKAMNNAHAPYSKFRVGAAILLTNGKIFSGCNVENASYGMTNCAERTAIFSAVAELGPRLPYGNVVTYSFFQDAPLSTQLIPTMNQLPNF